MRLRIQPSSLSGSIIIPSSKSQTLRAILFGALAHGKTLVHSPLPSPDTDAMIHACQMMGATIASENNALTILGFNGRPHAADNVIDAGNSGLVLRFAGAVSALSPHYTVLTGDHSIRHRRPVKPLLDALSQLGVTALSTRGDGFAPIIIKGPLKPGIAHLPGEDSQPVSGLLIASAFTSGPTELVVQNPGEKPWIRLTLDWLQRLGIAYSHDNFTHYRIQGSSAIEGFTYTVPGDWSSAAYPIAAAILTQSELTVHNVDMEESQGDKKIITILQQMGARIEYDAATRTVHVKKGPRLQGIKIDVNDVIDAITLLAVIGCYAEGKTEIINAQIARHKECDRIASIAKELRKMGARIEEMPDGLIIEQSFLKGAEVDSCQDHRMAMSLAVAGWGAKGETCIQKSEVVAKTFPQFARQFQTLGAAIREET